MVNRISIASALKSAANGAGPAESPGSTDSTDSNTQPVRIEPVRRAATRVGKKMIAAPIDPVAHKQLKMLAAEMETKAEELIREALRDLFVKYGKLPIA